MTRLRQLLHKNKITLIVDLATNDSQMARLAEQFGADALMVNSPNNADEIYSNVSIPTGINIKFAKKADKKLIQSLKPFDFVNFEIESADQLKDLPLTRVAVVEPDYSIDFLMGQGGKIDAIDAAIIPISQAAKSLAVGDLQNYISIIISSDLPVIIPTQRLITPSEVAIVADAGAKGIILTSVVLGNTPRSFERVIREFRIAVDDLSE